MYVRGGMEAIPGSYTFGSAPLPRPAGDQIVLGAVMPANYPLPDHPHQVERRFRNAGESRFPVSR